MVLLLNTSQDSTLSTPNPQVVICDSMPDVTSHVDAFAHLQPVIDSLPQKLSPEEYREAVQFVKDMSQRRETSRRRYRDRTG